MTRRAFTLLELLVAMAVLALVLAVMLQVTNGILQATLAQNQQLDSTAAARRALDVLATDMENAVVGSTSAILVPASASDRLLSFITSRGGPGVSNHRFLAVSYATNNLTLQRRYASITYPEANLPGALGNATFTTPGEPLADGVLALRILARADGTNSYPIANSPSSNWAIASSYNGLPLPAGFKALLTPAASFASGLTNRTRSLEVWIATIDPQNQRLLSQSGRLPDVQSSLANATDASTWRTLIDDSTSLPSRLKSGIRIQKATLPVP